MTCFSFLKADQFEGAKIISHIYHEMSLHIGYCKGFGVSKEEIEASEESQGMGTPEKKHFKS